MRAWAESGATMADSVLTRYSPLDFTFGTYSPSCWKYDALVKACLYAAATRAAGKLLLVPSTSASCVNTPPPSSDSESLDSANAFHDKPRISSVRRVNPANRLRSYDAPTN